MSDADAPGRNRPGRRPKDQKRIPLSLRITPAMRSRLVALAEENGRSVSQQTEFLLELALAGGASQDLSPPSTEKQWRGPQDRSRWRGPQDNHPVWGWADFLFGPQIAGLSIVVGHAMMVAVANSLAWSRDVAERSRGFPAVEAGTGATLDQIMELDKSLHQSMPSRREESWFAFADDPYIFGQVANAARYVLETIAPEGDPSVLPRPPRGIAPDLAGTFMRTWGEAAGKRAISSLLTDDKEFPGSISMWPAREWLGEAVIARLRKKLSVELTPNPTEDQNDGK